MWKLVLPAAACLPPHRDSSRVGMALVAGFVLMLLVDRGERRARGALTRPRRWQGEGEGLQVRG